MIQVEMEVSLTVSGFAEKRSAEFSVAVQIYEKVKVINRGGGVLYSEFDGGVKRVEFFFKYFEVRDRPKIDEEDIIYEAFKIQN